MLTAEETTTLLPSERLALTAHLATVTRDHQIAEDVHQGVRVQAIVHREPLRSDPILSAGEEGAPDMAVRFDEPVVNGPGPDDLADMGFAKGESRRDLFIQDAADDDQRVDPAMIIGPPHGVSE